ncbi:MAG: NfeD family protein [Thiotrichales bacterium]|nr:NfeD family protein [Thiotrichales bacterium]MBT4654098.1 NfeD family protein [Thiotrichales bacterium]MBT5984905.1 NfeD family protein [Thiotrichales bacterium]MBT7149581.1 NfeD family protein [Thiotrichales bacterium]MBT7933991.1 NfeD family protein [Thiotrichales bacterium]
MDIFFDNLNFIHWLALGLAMVIIELFLWTTFLLWIGASAITVSIVFYLIPDIGGLTQLLTFLVISVAATYLSKRYYPVKTVDDELHEKAKTYIGKECKVSSIENDVIKVQIGKSLWFAKGQELSVGQIVKIVDVDSSTFIVEPINS